MAYAKLLCHVKKKKSHQSIRFHPRPLVPCSFACGRKTHVCIKNSRCMSVDSILVLSIVSFVGENTHVCIKKLPLYPPPSLWRKPLVGKKNSCGCFGCSDCGLYAVPLFRLCVVHSDCTLSRSFRRRPLLYHIKEFLLVFEYSL